MDSCNSAGGYIHGLHLAKKCIPCRTYTRCGRYNFLSLFLFLFRYPKSSDLAALSPSYHPPVRRKPHYTTPEKIGSTSCALNALRSTTMGRVLRHYVAGGDRITDRYDLARFQRGSEILSRTRMNGPIFFLFGDRARNPRELPNSRDPTITRGNYAVAWIFSAARVYMYIN